MDLSSPYMDISRDRRIGWHPYMVFLLSLYVSIYGIHIHACTDAPMLVKPSLEVQRPLSLLCAVGVWVPCPCVSLRARAHTHVRPHARTQAAQEDLRRAEMREQSDGKMAAITKLHAEQAQADKGAADRQLEEVTQRLREAERTLALVASRPTEAQAGSPLAGGSAGEGRGAVVDELMQRLRCVGVWVCGCVVFGCVCFEPPLAVRMSSGACARGRVCRCVVRVS